MTSAKDVGRAKDLERIEKLHIDHGKLCFKCAIAALLMAIWTRMPGVIFQPEIPGVRLPFLNVGYAITYGPILILAMTLSVLVARLRISRLVDIFLLETRNSPGSGIGISIGDAFVLSGSLPASAGQTARDPTERNPKPPLARLISQHLFKILPRIHDFIYVFLIPVGSYVVILRGFLGFCSKDSKLLDCTWSWQQRTISLLFGHFDGGLPAALAADQYLGFPWIYPIWETWVLLLGLLPCIGFCATSLKLASDYARSVQVAALGPGSARSRISEQTPQQEADSGHVQAEQGEATDLTA